MSHLAASVADNYLSATACFFVHARAEPGVMPRVLELFAKRGLVPSFWQSSTSGSDRSLLTIDIRMRGLASVLVRPAVSIAFRVALSDDIPVVPERRCARSDITSPAAPLGEPAVAVTALG